MGKKYKYKKAELAAMIYQIEFAHLSIKERNEKLMELLDDTGDIPVWSPYTMRLYLREMMKADESSLNKFTCEEETEYYNVICMPSGGEWCVNRNFRSLTDAEECLRSEMPKADGDLRHIYRFGKDKEHGLVIASYNSSGEITGFGGDGWEQSTRNRLHNLYCIFNIGTFRSEDYI